MLVARSRLAFRVLIAVVLVLAVVQVYYYFCRTVDDLFISLRFAERLVDGHGLSYNDGERVEGFSSPLWLLLQASLIALGVDGVVATKLLSLAAYALLLFGVYRMARVVFVTSKVAAWVAVGLVAASSYVAAWAMWGLETPLFLALLVHLTTRMHEATRTGLAPLPRRRGVALVALALALLATRPEAPLYVLALGLAALLDDPSRPALRMTIRRLAPWVVVLVALVGALLVLRHAYFGEWLPQTYFAKRGGDLSLVKLAPLVSQGAPWPEVMVHVGALGLALRWAWRRRVWAPLLLIVANLIFIAKVDVDWMPSIRHALPIVVLAGPLWAGLVDELARSRGARRVRGASVLVGALLLVHVVVSFRIDARYSRYDFGTHGGGERWIRPKDARGWETAWSAIRRVAPAHIRDMGPEQLGMVMQVFHALEASDAPLASSWVIARDVGMLGYLLPVQVFETDGLFTPALTASPAWVARRDVDDALLDVAFARTLVFTELYDAWASGFGRRDDLQARFEVTQGRSRAPSGVVTRDLVPPSADALRQRYAAVRARLDTFFYVGTLYGESVGAAVEKRWRWAMARLAPTGPDVVARPPDGLLPTPPVLLDDGAIRVHGCRLESTPGDPMLACYFEALRPPSRDWQVFVHGVDDAGARRLHVDHAPASGRRPAKGWVAGEIIRDATPIATAELAGPISIRFGLWHGDAMARVDAGPGEAAVDDEGRLRGPRVDPSDAP